MKIEAKTAIAWLNKNSSKKVRDGMARYGLPSDKALGVGVGAIQQYGKRLGRDPALAEALCATDERNFVKKGVSWAVRMVGGQSPGLRRACTGLARSLAESESGSARWVGKDALREFAKR